MSQEESQNLENRVKRVGNYLLGKTLGQGSFGKVKLATHTITNEKVAMKILDKERIHDVSDMERITREINVLKLLYHPNVIKLYEVIDTQRHIYIVTEFADGGELFDYIVHHGRLKEREACRFFHMLINGVDYCHSHLIIHRDLKPENLLLNSNRNLKIIDFGLSNRIKPGGLLKTACGSPCYAAPEMIEGKMYVGQMSDIWSCGVILFALVCGYLPFEDQNTQALYQKILNARYRCPSHLTNECKHLIAKILNTDPTKRYTSAQIRQHPWFIENFVGQTIEEVQVKDGIVQQAQIDSVIDESVVAELEKLGFPRDNTIMCIKAKKHNQVVAAYRLLLEKRMREAQDAGQQYTLVPAKEGAAAPQAPGSPQKVPLSTTPQLPQQAVTIQPTQPVVVVPPKGPSDADEDMMQAAKTQAKANRRQSLFAGSNAAPTAVTFLQGPLKAGPKDEDGKDIIPANYAGQMKVGTRPGVGGQGPTPAMPALSDQDEDDDDTAELLKQAAAIQAQKAGGGAPAAGATGATAAKPAAAAADDDEEGEEMPAAQQQNSAAARAAYLNRRRVSVAVQRDAQSQLADLQQMKQNAKDTPAEGAAGQQQQKDVRVFRGLFNVSATSSKPPEIILKEVEDLLKQKNITPKRVGETFVLKCDYTAKAIRFEVEICRLPRLDEVCFVNMKRISGETFAWKEFCTQFFSALQL
ncbi:MAG: putative Serine/threonine protein kinase OSK3 [Streblomastix strix]|uniref:non-specific serine/threonine protein kinase n=1 Tax=Streblomastix strix TaxID=222440 RepID=A0A5J4WYN4_9EUKA|nr:MAG: putative Serine/threonine protein kinase OSK3 [Streblomastix strix]